MLLSALIALAAVLNVVAQPEVRPPSQQVKSPGSGALTCVFESPLTDCRVRVSGQAGYNMDSVLEFTLGPQSPSVLVLSSTEASYFGEGLHKGHCGVQLRMYTRLHPVVLVECFGETGNGTWTKAFGILTAYPADVIPITSPSPTSILTSPGSDVSVLLKTLDGEALTECYVRSRTVQGYVTWSASEDRPTDGRLSLHGAVATKGECGASIVNVTREDKGVLRWHGYRRDPESWVWQATVLLVLEAPEGLPVLEVQGPSSVGSLLEATCVAPPSVPPARLSWLLGDRVLRDDAGNETAPADIAKSFPWEKQATVQTFRRVLQAEDLGQRLECRMNHEALPSGKSVGHLIHVSAHDGNAESDDRPILHVDERQSGGGAVR